MDPASRRRDAGTGSGADADRKERWWAAYLQGLSQQGVGDRKLPWHRRHVEQLLARVPGVPAKRVRSADVDEHLAAHDLWHHYRPIATAVGLVDWRDWVMLLPYVTQIGRSSSSSGSSEGPKGGGTRSCRASGTIEELSEASGGSSDRSRGRRSSSRAP